jgi:hypothetical protein
VILHRDDDAIHRHLEPARRGLDDAQIGLMRHEPVELRLIDPIGGKRFFDRLTELCHRYLEDLIPDHRNRHERLLRSTRAESLRDTCAAEEQIFVGSVGVQVR